MDYNPIEVKFLNKKNPKSAFDMLKLEGLFNRRQLDHDIEKIHRVEFFILIIVTDGQGFHTIDFTDYEIEKGTIITIRKDQIHRFHRGNDLKGYLLLFKDEFLISYLEKLEVQKSLQLFNELLGAPKLQLTQTSHQPIFDIIDRMDKEYFQQMDDYSLSIIRSELHILITKLYRIKSQIIPNIVDKRYLSEFITFQALVEQNAMNTTRVNDYAAMLRVSTKTLNTITKSIVYKTAKAFIDEISIKQIKRLLINTTLSVKEIAFESGFKETTNFYKYFKRHVHLTPEQFRDST